MKSGTKKKLLAMGGFVGVLIVAVVLAVHFTRSPLQRLPDGSWMEIVHVDYGYIHFQSNRYQKGLGERIFRCLPASWHLLLRSYLPDRWQEWTYADIDIPIVSGSPSLFVVALTNYQPASVELNTLGGKGKWGCVGMIISDEQGHTYGIVPSIQYPPIRVGGINQLEWEMEEKFYRDQKRLILRLYAMEAGHIDNRPLAEFVIDNPAYAGGR